jgi:hypothetical protein
MIALLAAAALAAPLPTGRPCTELFAPVDVVEAALRLDGARRAGLDPAPEERTLLTRLSCVSEPLTEADAAAVHLALTSSPLVGRPPPEPDDAAEGPPHPSDGVALVDGQAYAALRRGPAVIQAFDAEGRAVYTRWLDADGVRAVQAGATLPDTPSLPRLPPRPLDRGEIIRLAASGALLVGAGTLFVVAADARADWYALNPSPVETPEELERLRVRNNVAQGAGFALSGLGVAGMLSVAVRVPL